MPRTSRRYVGLELYSAFIIALGLFLLGSSCVYGQDFTDWSGQVHVRVYLGPWVYGQHNVTTVSVDTDYVLVGGGAEIYGAGNPGALLTASNPDLNLTTWHASSKDHVNPYPHSLRAYAIGLRLDGVSSTDLRNYMVLVTQTSTPAHHPNAIAALPPGIFAHRWWRSGKLDWRWTPVDGVLSKRFPVGRFREGSSHS